MDLTRKLQEWGAAQAQARSAERAGAQQGKSDSIEARRLRERADHLHREIYEQIGRPQAQRLT